MSVMAKAGCSAPTVQQSPETIHCISHLPMHVIMLCMHVSWGGWELMNFRLPRVWHPISKPPRMRSIHQASQLNPTSRRTTKKEALVPSSLQSSLCAISSRPSGPAPLVLGPRATMTSEHPRPVSRGAHLHPAGQLGAAALAISLAVSGSDSKI